ncbi:hypothetical protein DEU56DRAFT_982896 [Suillus clintonianus]|uniref:uncharacterized protein n=1 Tax=Suillus clintonianus TaxID=1904413 RepID=UPI001B87CF53|nr:uncharacterized protein DEU56DRAFT_982896 [Suillus clintonianus]KAG2126595.1 hypothetical protein DEU56DRAFT_982896 [Suillus clintonianus]
MQLSVLFSALVSFVILAAASPTAEKLSSKREELESKFVDYQEREELNIVVGTYHKREELEDKFVDYQEREELNVVVGTYREREELEDKFVDYQEREELNIVVGTY